MGGKENDERKKSTNLAINVLHHKVVAQVDKDPSKETRDVGSDEVDGGELAAADVTEPEIPLKGGPHGDDYAKGAFHNLLLSELSLNGVHLN